MQGVEKSNMKTNSCYATLVQVKKDPLFTTAPNPAYASQANLIGHSTIPVRPPRPQKSNENNFDRNSVLSGSYISTYANLRTFF